MHRILATALIAFCLAATEAAATVANDLCAPSADPCVVSGAQSATPGSILDFGGRQLLVTSSGGVTVAGGPLTILAGSVRLQSHGELIGLFAQNTLPSITVTTPGAIRIETGGSGLGRIVVNSVDAAGQIDLVAGGNILIDGELSASASDDKGSGGTINVTATGNVSGMGPISARGGSNFGLGGSITIQAGGAFQSTGDIHADGGDGGDLDISALNGDVNIVQELNVSAGGTYGDGGSLIIAASRNLGVSGSVILQGAGSEIEGGGAGGDVALEATAGTISVSGTIDNHGAAPDGTGGDFDAFAGVDFTLTGTGKILMPGNGFEGCGGFASIAAERQVSILSKIDMAGGSCGGDLFIDGSIAQVSAAGDIGADAGSGGGSFNIRAEQITMAGKMNASGLGQEGSPGSGGFIQLAGCAINIAQGGVIKTDGEFGQNLLQAGGQLTIGSQAQMLSRPTGKNRFEFRDPSKPPVISGSATVNRTQECAPATGCMNPLLNACAAAAVCGNGVPEGSEGCDDSNTAACDGCSASCRVEQCGNAVVECDEECDDGPSNGGPGSPCDATCHVAQGADTVFVPGSRHGRGCMLEWAVRSAAISGFPPSTLTCVDGDPACDADGVSDGGCTFNVSACLNVTDARIPSCQPFEVEDVNLRRPSATSPDDAIDDANAQALVDALVTLGLTVRSRHTVLYQGTPLSGADRCTPTVAQRVPHPPGGVGRRLLSAGASDTSDHSVSNRTVLACAPNPAVCGNGAIEIGEQCDDDNAAACDGCSEFCRVERCGDGVVQCGEQCDGGANNGQPGSPCSAACTEVPPANRIPGGKSSRDCLGEWSFATDALATSTSGLPLTKQTCVDNSACDFDPTPGVCRLHVWICLSGDDPRIECAADGVASLGLVRPSATQTGPAAAARQALVQAFGRMAFPAGPGEVCSPRIDLSWPAGKAKLQLTSEAQATSGLRDRDSLKLLCAPSP